MGRFINKDTIVLGQSREDVVKKIMNLVRVRGEFKDFEWDIERDPKTLYINGQLLTKDPHRIHYEKVGCRYNYNSVERLSKRVQNSHFFVGPAKSGDVKQGGLGDCRFLAFLSAAADIPGLIDSIAVARKEDSCIYGFVFFKKYRWMGVLVDDYLFFKPGERLLFSECSDPTMTWVPLLEKAYAKCHDNYETIDYECTRDALIGLGGKDYKPYDTDVTTAEKKELWDLLISAKEENRIFICANAKNTQDNGLHERHFYSIIRAVNFHNNELIEVRNPWTHGEWRGRWSDNSHEWNPWKKWKGDKYYIEELEYSLQDDGSFFMLYDDLLSHFNTIECCRYEPSAGPDLTNDLISSWWNGEYNVYCTTVLGQRQPELSILKLRFSALQHSGNLTLSVTSNGKDDIGIYTIDNGRFRPSSKDIFFTKRYAFCNGNCSLIHYQGCYRNKLFFGTWGTQRTHGNFIIKRAIKAESLPISGNWLGCYLYNLSRDYIDRYSISLNISGNVISGSGSDSVGRFSINGRMSFDGTVNFVKSYSTHSWNYDGRMYGDEIWGTWGTIGTPNCGAFLMWRHQ